MKNYVYLIIFMFSINTFGQVTEEKDQVIIEKALYSKQEKEDMLAKYKTDVDIIGMTPEVKELYMNLITSNFQKMIILNKDRNNTQKELKQRLKVVLEDQRVELKKILGTGFMRGTNNVWVYNAGTANCGFGLCFHFLNATIQGDQVTQVTHQTYVD